MEMSTASTAGYYEYCVHSWVLRVLRPQLGIKSTASTAGYYFMTFSHLTIRKAIHVDKIEQNCL